MKIFVSAPVGCIVRRTFFTEAARAYLEQRFEVVYSPLERHLLPHEFAGYAADADVIMTGWGHPRLTAEMLEGTAVRLIAHTGASVADYVASDVFARGIRVISGNDLYAESVAEGTLAYILTALRRIPEHIECMRDGGWEPACSTEGLLDQTVGIVGMGAISRKLIAMLKPFRVKLKVYSDRPIDGQYLKENNALQVSLEEVFSTCKVVSLHRALNGRTRESVGKAQLSLLPEGAVFLNTARAGIIRENDLIEALKENRFRAVLDVYHSEPLAEDSPLRTLPNVYLLPHKAGPTFDRRPMVVTALAEDILRFACGDVLYYEITSHQAKRMTQEK